MERQNTKTASTSIWIRFFGAIGFGLFGFSILFIIYYGAIDDSFSMIRNVFGFIGALLGNMYNSTAKQISVEHYFSNKIRVVFFLVFRLVPL